MKPKLFHVFLAIAFTATALYHISNFHTITHTIKKWWYSEIPEEWAPILKPGAYYSNMRDHKIDRFGRIDSVNSGYIQHTEFSISDSGHTYVLHYLDFLNLYENFIVPPEVSSGNFISVFVLDYDGTPRPAVSRK